MAEIASGIEQTDWNIFAGDGEQLEINVTATTFTLTATGMTRAVIQLGNAGNTLHASGGIVAVTIKVTPIDTGDKCFIQQKQMNVVAGTDFVLVVSDEFWAEAGSIIEVHAKGTNSNDTSIGGKAWLVDVTSGGTTIAVDIVAALMADTGFTVGGSMTYEELMKLLAAWIAGNWRDKSGDADTKQLLDADDAATVVLEMSLLETTPQRTITII